MMNQCWIDSTAGSSPVKNRSADWPVYVPVNRSVKWSGEPKETPLVKPNARSHRSVTESGDAFDDWAIDDRPMDDRPMDDRPMDDRGYRRSTVTVIDLSIEYIFIPVAAFQIQVDETEA